MLSKPVAALLLVGALFGAAVGGAYIAIRVYDQPAEGEDLVDIEDDLPSVDDDSKSQGEKSAKTGKPPRPQYVSPSAPVSQVPQAGASGNGGGPVAGSAAPSGGQVSPAGQGAGATVTGAAAAASAASDAKKEPTFEDIEVPTDTLIAIRLQAELSSESAKVEDRVEARVTKPVQVRGKLVIPAETLVVGHVSVADKGGPMSNRARLDVRFETLRIPHTPEVPIVVDAVTTMGPSPTKGTKGRVAGGAAGGAALGWLKGGLPGAITGGAIGGGAGVGARVVEGRQPITIPAGAETQIQLRAPAIVTIQQ